MNVVQPWLDLPIQYSINPSSNIQFLQSLTRDRDSMQGACGHIHYAAYGNCAAFKKFGKMPFARGHNVQMLTSLDEHVGSMRETNPLKYIGTI